MNIKNFSGGILVCTCSPVLCFKAFGALRQQAAFSTEVSPGAGIRGFYLVLCFSTFGAPSVFLVLHGWRSRALFFGIPLPACTILGFSIFGVDALVLCFPAFGALLGAGFGFSIFRSLGRASADLGLGGPGGPGALFVRRRLGLQKGSP